MSMEGIVMLDFWLGWFYVAPTLPALLVKENVRLPSVNFFFQANAGS